MAKTSSGRNDRSPNTSGVRATKLSYARLLARGADMDALLAEHLAVNGAEGVLALASAVNAVPVLLDDHDSVAMVGACETLKSVAIAKQAEHALCYQDSLATQRRELGVRKNNPEWGAKGDLALAMHLTPKSGAKTANDFRILIEDLPRTHQGMRDGVLTWDQVMVIIGGVRRLCVANRAMVDELLWEETHTCFTAGTAKLREMVTYWALILEPAVEEDLEAKAEKDRHLEVYQVDEFSVRVTGKTTLEEGIALQQVLARETEKARLDPNDERNPGQVGIDALYEAMTGLRAGGSIPVGLLLVMDLATLSGGADHPVLLPGNGYVSARKGRELLAGDPDESFETWWRRLYVAPETGELVAMDSKARRFTGNLKRFIGLRDQYCRTPYCNGKIREMDHVVQVRRDGKSTAANSAGRCRPCNRTKEAPGWDEKPVPGDRHSFLITTPSGHSHVSKAPPMLGIATPALLLPEGGRRSGKPQRE